MEENYYQVRFELELKLCELCTKRQKYESFRMLHGVSDIKLGIIKQEIEYYKIMKKIPFKENT